MVSPPKKDDDDEEEDSNTASPSNASEEEHASAPQAIESSTVTSSSEQQQGPSHPSFPADNTSDHHGGGASGYPPPSPRRHHHTVRLHANSDIDQLMREQDADLLESIHLSAANDSCTGQTPLLLGRAGSAKHLLVGHSSSGTIPELLLEHPAAGAGAVAHAQAQGALGAAATSDCASVTSSNAGLVFPENGETELLRGEIFLAEGSGGGGGGGGGPLHSFPRPRRALSGEIVWTEKQQAPLSEPSTSAGPSPDNIGTQPQHQQQQQQQPLSETAEEPPFKQEDGDDQGDVGVPGIVTSESILYTPRSQRSLHRTDSMDRRLNEAAQFAEAIGESLVDDQSEICIIEDDEDEGIDEDDDEDEGATEIHLPKPGEHLGEPSSTGMQEEVVSVSDAKTEQELVLKLQSKSRPLWPFHPLRKSMGFLDKLGASSASYNSLQQQEQNFVYKGIRANPPEIVKRGTTRGNYAQLHRKAWLEVSDKYHRYGKHLRLYYRHWESLGCPTNMFFDWLDSKGEAAGQPLPELESCPRAQLDSDTVLYITNPDTTEGYGLRFVADDDTGRGKVLDVDGDAVQTGTDGWIFVIRDNVMYGAQKITSVSGHAKQRFHHSSFFGGKAVAAAGIFITDDDGYLTRLYPHSGHYRPGEAHMQRMLFFLHNEGVDLSTFEMDMQQILHVAREKEPPNAGGGGGGGEKAEKLKKLESLHLVPSALVAGFLAHKARFIGEGIFSQIHWIRKADVASVSEALELIDGEGRGRMSSQQSVQE